MSIDDGGCGSHTQGALGCKVLLREYQVITSYLWFSASSEICKPLAMFEKFNRGLVYERSFFDRIS